MRVSIPIGIRVRLRSRRKAQEVWGEVVRRPVVTSRKECNGEESIWFFATDLFVGAAQDMAKERVNFSAEGGPVAQGTREAAGKALQEEANFDGADLTLGSGSIGEADGSDEEIGQEDANELGIEFAKDTCGTEGGNDIECGEGFAELEDEFDLPADAIKCGDVFSAEHGLWHIGDKERPIEQLQVGLVGRAAMAFGIVFGFLALAVGRFLG